jgi:hypothetical protein
VPAVENLGSVVVVVDVVVVVLVVVELVVVVSGVIVSSTVLVVERDVHAAAIRVNASTAPMARRETMEGIVTGGSSCAVLCRGRRFDPSMLRRVCSRNATL